MQHIVIVGASGHAKVVVDILERQGEHRIAGLLDRSRPVGERLLGYEILGREADLPQLVEERAISGVIVAIGDNWVRSQVADRIAELCPQIRFVSAVHPRAAIACDVLVGDGTVIMAGVAVNPSCAIGRFCILNTNSSLDHDSVMEDFSSLAPRAVTGGNCRIGAFGAVGIGATLSHGIRVGEQTVIGAGAVVLADVDAERVAYGVPARVVRERRPGDRYL